MRVGHIIFWNKKSVVLKLLHMKWAKERKTVPDIARSLDGYRTIKKLDPGFRICRPHYRRFAFAAPAPSWKREAGVYLREKRVIQLSRVKPQSAILSNVIKSSMRDHALGIWVR